jgi:hypothetical protein
MENILCVEEEIVLTFGILLLVFINYGMPRKNPFYAEGDKKYSRFTIV